MHEVLIEESVLGWKEFELEVMRDQADNAIIVCSIENFDPMGVHTGDSITVAPAQTLTDREYQMMRDASLACLRKIGVDTGGSNVQFAIDPEDRPHGDRGDEYRGCREAPRWRRRPRDFQSPRSRPSSPWAIVWTKSRTTLRARLRRALNRKSNAVATIGGAYRQVVTSVDVLMRCYFHSGAVDLAGICLGVPLLEYPRRF